MDLGAVWIHVETWNELHEGTGICWTQEHGFQWIGETATATYKFHAPLEHNPLFALNTGKFYFLCIQPN
ncbi:MAG: hypothetical protein Q6373_024095 [Candidatus Sigynarchaeota archaeon]